MHSACTVYISHNYHSIWDHVQLGSQYCDVIMGMIASQITSLTIVYSTVYSSIDQRKHQSFASLVFEARIHLLPVNSLRKCPVTPQMFPFDDVILILAMCILPPLVGVIFTIYEAAWMWTIKRVRVYASNYIMHSTLDTILNVTEFCYLVSNCSWPVQTMWRSIADCLLLLVLHI